MRSFGLTAFLLLAGTTATSAAEKRKNPPPPIPWSFQPLHRVDLPAVKNTAWARTRIDRFILAKIEAAGLQPAPPADSRTLLRRLSFDLTGLPPTM
eukprot:gene8246-10170_t